MDLKEGNIMHEQMYPSFLNTDREADCKCPLYLVIYAFFSA